MTKFPLYWLSQAETDKILQLAKSQDTRDWLILELCRHGLRDGEILGRGRLPGIHVRDLRSNGVWLVGKGYSQDPPSLYPLPSWLVAELDRFRIERGRGQEAKLFDLGVRRLEQLIKQYAKLAGIQDWKMVKPHRLRAFFATDLDERDYGAFTIRNAMRHKNIGTTNRYVGKGSPERMQKIMNELKN